MLENGAREFEVDLADVVYDTPPLINYQRLVFPHSTAGTEFMGGDAKGLGEEKASWGSPSGTNLFAAQEDKAGAPVGMMLGDGVWSGRGMNVLVDNQLPGCEHTLTWDEQTESAAPTGQSIPVLQALRICCLLYFYSFLTNPSSP